MRVSIAFGGFILSPHILSPELYIPYMADPEQKLRKSDAPLELCGGIQETIVVHSAPQHPNGTINKKGNNPCVDPYATTRNRGKEMKSTQSMDVAK